jgi:hypothetical protein
MMPSDYTFVPNVFGYLKKKLPQLHKWLISTFGKDYDSFVAVKVSDADDDDDVTLLFWTAEYVFCFTVNSILPRRTPILRSVRSSRNRRTTKSRVRAAK